MKTCEFCGKSYKPAFARNAAIQRFCSGQCQRDYVSTDPAWRICRAYNCTNLFQVTSKKANHQKFCTPRCGNRHRSWVNRVQWKLEIRECAAVSCSSKFQPIRTYHAYCSKRCRGKEYRRRLRGEASSSRECDECGAEFRPWRPNHRFCSARCRRRVSVRRYRATEKGSEIHRRHQRRYYQETIEYQRRQRRLRWKKEHR